MAETGSGKTRANAKIMAALGSEMRFATLLGLRTLTLQTLDEYRDNLAIPKNNIIGIIGDNTTQILHDLNKAKPEKVQANHTALENKESSTLNDLLKEEAQIKISEKGFKDVDTPFPKELDFPNKRDSKLDKISKIPVLVATIDYMIQGIDAGRSSKSRYLSRLMTSDIIIDEIDSYNQNDLMAIHKLAYLVGFYGKKLIISSATLPELLIESFYLAYSTGYQRFKVYTDKPKSSLYIGLFTHHSPLNQVSKIEKESSQIKAITTPFIDQFYHAIKEEIPKRKASLLDISAFLHQDIKSYDKQYLILSPLYKKIFQQAEQLHQYNHTEIDGITVSTGLIKFNNTVDAFNFSQHLFNSDDLENNAVVKIECYHARHFPIRRNYTEESLSQLLNRKKGKAKKDQFENLSIVKNAIKIAKERNKKQILLLVVSTTIIEIGRDFDFDWGIIEPTSHWSIVQTAGRIMRHRHKDYCHNISLLSHSMKAVRYAKDQRKLYTRPGPESNAEFCLSQTDKYQSVEQLFEYKQLSKKIDASITLKNQATSPMKKLENKQIEFFKENQNLGSLHSYLNNPLEYLSKFNSEINPFRGKYQNQFIYCLNEHNQWEVIDKKKKTRLDANDNFDPIEITYPERRLLPLALDEIEISYHQKGIELEREIYSLSDLDTTKKYHELLGVL
jgi:CRISPR-associated endonuclease/helicase Cas3